MEFLQIIAEVKENDIARSFSIAIGIVFALSVLSFRVSRLATFSSHGSSLCTTLGVLGTFTGIFLGLLEFDVANIDESVPELLNGLKIAFSTSIVGLLASVTLRILYALFPTISESRIEVTPEVIHQTLENIRYTISRLADENSDAMNKLRQAISAENDSSLVTQLQKLRISLEDGNRDIIAELKKFSDDIVQNNSEALMEALEKVIRDFNTQLNEQFGDNFKQLNQAVHAMVEWQNNYKKHVETLEDRIDSAVQALQSSETALSEVADHSKKIPEAFTAMQELLDNLVDATNELPQALDALTESTEGLNSQLEAVAELRNQAVEAFPIIEKNIEILTKNLSNTVQSHTDVINKSASEMQRQQNDQIKIMTEMIEKQFQLFDKQMEEEMNRAIETLGRNLASISEKLVDDYGPLIAKIRQAVDAAGGGVR